MAKTITCDVCGDVMPDGRTNAPGRWVEVLRSNG